MDINICIIAITNNIFNNCYDYINKTNYNLFGLDDNTCINNYLSYFNLPHNDIIFCPNKGFDVGPFLIGLNYCKDLDYDYIMNIHSKTNKQWRQDLFEICNYDIRNFNCDTIISKNWVNYFDENDMNINILNDYIDILPRNKNKWIYNGGKVFIIKTKYLKVLCNNFKSIYKELTDINKNDIFWKKKMIDLNTFNLCYNNCKESLFNSPIHIESRNMLIKTNSKNFFELLSHGYKGIPDFQLEHALERYIGYLHDDTIIMQV
jgi:hypothetical protein